MGLFKKKAQIAVEKNETYAAVVAALQRKEAELDGLMELFAKRAQEAKKNGSERPYELAIAGYRLQLVQRKQIRESLVALQTALSLQESAAKDEAFLAEMQNMSDKLRSLSGKRAYTQVSKAYAAALTENADRKEKAQVFLTDVAQGANANPSPTEGMEQTADEWVDEQVRLLEQSLS